MASEMRPRLQPALSPELMLRAYSAGIFPMADESGPSDVFWVDPRHRGVLPIDGFHISRSLARKIRAEPYSLRIDTAFEATVEGCADRPHTWINDAIHAGYMSLFAAGYAHSIEVWEGAHLVGGVFGVALREAFFGESMFSRRADASKIALAYLVQRLSVGGYRLFDTQFLTDHLASLGGIEISRQVYQSRLAEALEGEGDFFAQPEPVPASAVLQLRTQTS